MQDCGEWKLKIRFLDLRIVPHERKSSKIGEEDREVMAWVLNIKNYILIMKAIWITAQRFLHF